MHSFLAQKRAVSLQNITRQTKATRPDGCDNCINHDLTTGSGSFEVEKGYCICTNVYTALLAIADSLTAEGYDENKNKIGPVSNAWGASTGY